MEKGKNKRKKSFSSPVLVDTGNCEMATSLRDIPPAHYTLTIESFSQLSKMLSDAAVQNYESGIFEAGGYKWKLSLYPSGDKKRRGEGHVSLYLVIQGTEDDLPFGWEVNVDFKLFVFNGNQDKYLTIRDANQKVSRFHRMKTEWGFAKLLPLSVFNDAANGYLVHDKCVFGAEVSVINRTVQEDCLKTLNLLTRLDNTYTWKIDKFSSLSGEVHKSGVFAIGDRNWVLRLHPKGDSSAKDKCLSLYLGLNDWQSFPCGEKTCVTYKLRVIDQCHDKLSKSRGSTKCFEAPAFKWWGYPEFLTLTDLHDASKGFLVNDTLIVEAEISAITTFKNLSKEVSQKGFSSENEETATCVRKRSRIILTEDSDESL